jgi:predicted nucleic acid-binding protein
VIVLDASAVLELLLRTPGGDRVERRLVAAETLHAPYLLDVEVSQVLRRYCLSRVLDASRAAFALQDLAALDIARYPHEPMLARMWELRANLTAYDAAYVVLAETIDARLLTFDARMARASGHRARVELLKA